MLQLITYFTDTAVLPNTKYTSGDSSQQQRGMYLT